MRANELIAKAHLLKDSSGKRKAVQLDYKTWEELLEFLEDIEDMEEINRVQESCAEYIPWEQAKKDLRAKGVDV